MRFVALSPDLCTGWGSPCRRSARRSRARRPGGRAPAGDRPPARRASSSPGCPHVDTSTGGRTPSCTPGGDGPGRDQGIDGGDRPVTVHSGRVVHVSTQEEGSQPTAGQQALSRGDLHEQVRSPGSTDVMTQMKYFSQGVLEPHSGWGAPGRAVRGGTWHGTMSAAGEDGRSRRCPRDARTGPGRR